jgi:hypothetical protein
MIKTSTSTLLLLLMSVSIVLADDECSDSGGLSFICGTENAEDLVVVPGTDWVISSTFAEGEDAGFYLINSKDKSWSRLYTTDSSRVLHDTASYGACPGPPDLANFDSHGLNIRSGDDKQSTLYAVSHGGREAIEVFDVNTSGATPELTWVGCVLMPDGLAANSVASFSDGSIVATVLLMPGTTFSELLSGKPTGAVYEWTPGVDGFELIEGMELPGNNGIEVSVDEREVFVASSGLNTVVAFSHTNPARQLRTTRKLAFTPDNVRLSSDGQLLTSGMIDDEPACGGTPDPESATLPELAACPRGIIAASIEPTTMEDMNLLQTPANPDFSNATIAIRVGDEIWIGSFAGDRIAYWPQSSPQ